MSKKTSKNWVWDALGLHLGGVWEPLGRFGGSIWPLFGHFFSQFVRFFAHLNPFCSFFAIFAPKMVPRMHFGRVLGGFGKDWGRILEGFGEIWRRAWGDF